MISGTLNLFLVLSTLIQAIFNLDSYLSVMVKAILEMTMALYNLAKLSISDPLKVALATAIISFGGLSIHLQVISILEDKIKYRNYFKGRIYQMIISFFIAFLIMYLFN